MNVEIRDYQPSDYEVCYSLWGELTQHHADIYEDPTIAGDDPGRGFVDYINNPERRMASRRIPGSRGGPLGTAQLPSTPPNSRRKS